MTTFETLSGSKYFETLLSTQWKTSDDEIFIDRSPWIFKHVLNLLRDPKYEYPPKYASELEYYMIEVVVEPKRDELLEEIKEMRKEYKELFVNLSVKIIANDENLNDKIIMMP